MGKSQAKKSHKKNWQKIDHADVKNYLEEEREREKFSFLPYEEFFSIDKGASVKNNVQDEEPESDKLVDFSKLKCFQLQKPQSAVPDPVIKRNKINKNANVKIRKSYRNIQKDEGTPLIDPWDDSVEFKKKTGLEKIDAQWLSEDTRRVNSAIDKKRVGNKTTEIKAVEIPHPGFSINPSFRDHQDLLRKTLEIETAAINAEKKLIRATAVPRTAVKEDQSLIQGENADDDIEEEEEESDDDKKPILTKSKTKKQRRKEKESKETKHSLKEAKQAKVRESDVFTLKKIKRDIEKTEKKQKERLLKKIAKKTEAAKFGQKALSKWKFQQEKLDPLLSDELSGRMLDVKGSGQNSLLFDRFKSLQKRNILEVRVRQPMKRKNKKIKYTKAGDKEEWEKTGEWNGIKIDMTKRRKVHNPKPKPKSKPKRKY